MFAFPSFPHPIVQAPMAGGPSTPALAAAVSNAGGFGFLATGYKSLATVRADVQRTRELTSKPFGVNVFVPSQPATDRVALERYAAELQPDAARYDVELGTPRFDDDGFADKLALAISERVAVVSFVFGCPTRDVVDRLHASGIAVWVTATELQEALIAERAGADALVLQGVEAGGHRGSFEDRDGVGELGVLSLLRVCARRSSLPLIAAGGIGDGEGVAAVLAAGARAAQIGTAFLRCPEAATNAPHRAALASAGDAPGRTRLTRAFTGKRARGLVNRFLLDHSAHAPAAYPEVGLITQPLRAAGVEAGDADVINLWSGQAHALAEERPAGELVTEWSAVARQSLTAALTRC